jgi:hypothetical protein
MDYFNKKDTPKAPDEIRHTTLALRRRNLGPMQHNTRFCVLCVDSSKNDPQFVIVSIHSDETQLAETLKQATSPRIVVCAIDVTAPPKPDIYVFSWYDLSSARA